MLNGINSASNYTKNSFCKLDNLFYPKKIEYDCEIFKITKEKVNMFCSRFNLFTRTTFSTISGVWFGTILTENLPITLRGITVLAPGSLNAPWVNFKALFSFNGTGQIIW